MDAKLVERAGVDPRNETGPPVIPVALHGRGVLVPVVEVADDGHARSVWRDDSEARASAASDHREMGAEMKVEASLLRKMVHLRGILSTSRANGQVDCLHRRR